MTPEEKRLKTRELEEKLNRQDVVKALLSQKNGRDFLWWLLSITRSIGGQPFTGNSLTTSFNCGKQDVGTEILNLITETDSRGLGTLFLERASDDDRNDDTDGTGHDYYDADGGSTPYGDAGDSVGT